MIGFALLILAADVQNPTVPPANVEEVRKQFGKGRFQTGNDGQTLICKVTRTTGDADLDSGFCDAFRACSADAGPNILALMPCISRKEDELFERVAAQRAAQMNGAPK
jgi:hypothetical protein